MQINIIDIVPIELRKKVITLRSSNLSQRSQGVYQMYHDLMYHQSKDWVWPNGNMKELIQKWLFKSDFRQYSYQNHEVVIKFIDNVLTYIQNEDLLINELDQQKQECVAELAKKKKAQEELLQQKIGLENIKISNHLIVNTSSPIRKNQAQGKQMIRLEEEINKIEQEIEQQNTKNQEIDHQLANICQNILNNIHQNWDQQVKMWKKIKDTFYFFQEFLDIPAYDLSRSFLQYHNAWFEIQKLQNLIVQCEEIHKIAESLGRLKNTEDHESSFDEIFEPIKRNKDLLKEIPDAVPESFDGVELSSSIARMLPSESILLLRPQLKKLFHLKRIEEKLNTYRPEGTRLEKEIMDEEKAEKSNQKKPKKGPIILCLDTSGSMHGTPENVAKAIALVLLKIAYAEKRPYMMYNFSGPGNFAKSEYIPTDSNQMIIDVLNLIGQRFGGGTDVDGPLKAAIKEIETKDWQKADILMVSDGGFDVSDQLVQDVKNCHQKHGTRFHGLLIGGYDHVMKKICNPLHYFNHW